MFAVLPWSTNKKGSLRIPEYGVISQHLGLPKESNALQTPLLLLKFSRSAQNWPFLAKSPEEELVCEFSGKFARLLTTPMSVLFLTGANGALGSTIRQLFLEKGWS